MSSYGILKVINRTTRQEIYIKADRFDEHIHEKIQHEHVMPKEYLVEPNKPIIINSNLAAADELAAVVEKAQSQSTPDLPLPDETEEEVKELELKKPKGKPKKVATPDYDSMKIYELKSLAKANGIKTLPSMKKTEIIAKLKAVGL